MAVMGHKIGFPTANLHAVKQFLPQDGVYACAVKLGKKFYRAGMNLGKRPTFQDDDHHRQAEVHILNYYGKLYGKDMKVYLLKYLRARKEILFLRSIGPANPEGFEGRPENPSQRVESSLKSLVSRPFRGVMSFTPPAKIPKIRLPWSHFRAQALRLCSGPIRFFHFA